MNIPAFASERFVITVETGQDRRKLFQIMFRKSDGSLFLSFPYYKDVAGLLTLATLRARAQYPASLSLLDGGKVTGHKVKYSHHPDGHVHFSQDGKIRTAIRKRSIPLLEAEGHLFTIQLQGLSDFSELDRKERLPLLSDKKTILNFRFEGSPPDAIKFVGHWHKKTSLLRRISQFGSKPWFICEKSDGSTAFGMLLRDAFLESGEDYLLLTCEAIPLVDKGRFSTLTFVGGFDRREIALDHAQDTSFLALAYPATESYEELRDQIGSVDHATPVGI